MSIVSAFQKSGLIPDVVPSSEPFKPSVSFSVLYPNEPKPFTTGVEMPRETTLGEPEISRVSLEEGKGHTYTLVMTDPDVPSRVNKDLGEFRHWLITGLKFPDGELKSIKTKASTTPYYPPSPPAGTDLHRYAFLLFEEPASGCSISPRAPENGWIREDRRPWNAMAFAKQYGLKLVGANFLLVRALPA